MARYIDVDALWRDVTSNIEDCGDILEIIERQQVVTINDTADEIIVTNCNHSAEDSKKVGRYTFGNDEFNLESAYHDCKLVFDGITDDDSFQEVDTGLILYYANEIIYALHEALQGKDTNVPSKDVIYRQDAIDALDLCYASIELDNDRPVNCYEGMFYTAIKMAFERLPSAQPETHEKRTETHACDCISRQAAIEALNEYFARIGKLKRKGLTEGEKAISLDTIGAIKTLPTADTDISGYSDKLWKMAYERGKRDALADFDMTEKIDKAHDDGYEQGYLQGKADYERKPGKWIIDGNPNNGWYKVICSECYEDITSVAPIIGFFPKCKVTWDFCPNCGCRMVKEGEEQNE